MYKKQRLSHGNLYFSCILVFENEFFSKKSYEFALFFQKIWSYQKKAVPLHPLSKRKCDINKLVRQFSWLEYMPVTHGVAGSSPVRTAKKQSIGVASFVMVIYRAGAYLASFERLQAILPSSENDYYRKGRQFTSSPNKFHTVVHTNF